MSLLYAYPDESASKVYLRNEKRARLWHRAKSHPYEDLDNDNKNGEHGLAKQSFEQAQFGHPLFFQKVAVDVEGSIYPSS